MKEANSLIKHLSKHYLSTLATNFKIVASGGCTSVNSLLIAVHSPLIKNILLTMDDQTESVLVTPDIDIKEVIAMMKVMYGEDEFGTVDKTVLDLFGLESFKTPIVIYEDWESFDQVRLGYSEISYIDVLPDQPSSAPVHIPEDDILVDVASDSSYKIPVDIPQPHKEKACSVPSDDLHDDLDSYKNSNKESIICSEASLHSYAKQPNLEEVVDLSDHVDSVSEKKKKTIFCEFCKKTFSSKKTKKYHVKSQHSQDPQFLSKITEIQNKMKTKVCCPLCDLQVGVRDLKNHIRTNHETHTLVEECDVCHKKFSNGSHLNRHIDQTHAELPLFKCKICKFSTKIRDSFKSHMETHRKGNLHECEKCDYGSKRAYDLKKHKCVSKKIKCSLCESKCATFEGLRKHMVRHHK